MAPSNSSVLLLSVAHGQLVPLTLCLVRGAICRSPSNSLKFGAADTSLLQVYCQLRRGTWLALKRAWMRWVPCTCWVNPMEKLPLNKLRFCRGCLHLLEDPDRTHGVTGIPPQDGSGGLCGICLQRQHGKQCKGCSFPDCKHEMMQCGGQVPGSPGH